MADKINSWKIWGVDFSYNYNTKQYIVWGKAYDNAKDAGNAIKNAEWFDKWWETTYTTASGKKYTNQGEFANLWPNAAKRNTGWSSFVDPSVLQDQLMNQKWGNTNIADKWWQSAVEALDTYNKTYNNVTDESGNKVETATKDKNGTPKVNQQATSTSTNDKWSFVSDYWDWSQSTTDVYWNTKVNKKFMENAEEAKRKAEAAAQAAQEEYEPKDTNWTQEDAAELNNNLDDELKSGITDQTNETLMNEIIESEKWPGAIETLAEETGIDLDSDAADYEDVDSIVNQSTYTSNVVDETPFDWWESREEPDYWEASRMWEQPVIYEKEIEEQEEEQNKWPLTNKRERDTTRIGRHW